ncbi:hypothetical protein RMATCC62417_04384 [Rhizopus microsporus]|nr:hypothetical protein RMATCC62417_04384 [Rhizopus microsporus]
MDTPSDDYMEVDEEEEIDIDHFNLSKERVEKMKQISSSLSCVHEFMDVDASENIKDEHDIKGQCIVMDNAPIHKLKVIKALIEERGYKYIYLPLYSSLFNPIEGLWSKVKAGVTRTPLTADDRLTDRICELAKKIIKKSVRG